MNGVSGDEANVSDGVCLDMETTTTDTNLSVGRAERPSAATGTVMRTDTLREYAREAGFTDVEVLQIEDLFFRFYRMVP